LPASEDRSDEERCEQQRLELVADPPEARVLRRAERRQRNPLGPLGEQHEVHHDDPDNEQEQPAVGPAHTREPQPTPERADGQERDDERLARHLRGAEGDAREQRSRHSRRRRARAHRGEQRDRARDDDQRRQLQAVVRVDLAVEAREARERIGRRSRRERPTLAAECSRRDVDDRHEARDACRGRVEQAVEASAEHDDRVPPVVRLGRALRRHRDDDRAHACRRPGGESRADQGRPGRNSAEMRVHLRAADELCERLPPVRRRAGSRDEQSDGAVHSHVTELRGTQVVDDEDPERR